MHRQREDALDSVYASGESDCFGEHREISGGVLRGRIGHSKDITGVGGKPHYTQTSKRTTQHNNNNNNQTDHTLGLAAMAKALLHCCSIHLSSSSRVLYLYFLSLFYLSVYDIIYRTSRTVGPSPQNP